MYRKQIVAFLLLSSLFSNLLGLTIFGQVDPNHGSPIVITIGRPNIWSLEQAHYLLARMHHRNLRLEPKAPDSLDPNSVNGTRIKLLRQILGISADYAQTKVPKPSPSPSEEKETAENKAELNVSLPESAIQELDKSFSDPKLNASTELDNLINFQYENIAKQLTLLRDEVGNDERLVFLELPQSIYTTPKKADNRVVQTWWRIVGFSRVKGSDENHPSQNCEESKDKTPELCENPEPIRQSMLVKYASNAYKIYNKLVTPSEDLKTENRKFVELGKDDSFQSSSIRTIDLIPRQSSLIVNQTYDSVSSINIWGGLSFLFGLGLKTNYQRQKEDFQQFLHQDIYASAFGKGETDFGWTFGPLPGTKRLAPGLRTTFAVVIVPKSAETVMLKAKGCFFKQSKNQPYQYQTTSNEKWAKFNDDGFCDQEKEFIVPIPNGGDYSGFHVDKIRYYGGQKPGSRTVVSVKGSDFSPQVNVMINGVSLCPAVGIAQPFLNAVNSQDANCIEKNGIIGDVEYVASDQIVFSFQMPEDFVGTPTIHLIGPGRAVYLNGLPRVKVNENPRNKKLEDVEYMFGSRLPNDFAIKDFKVFPTADPTKFTGLLIGNKFASNSQIFINGQSNGITKITRVSGEQIRFDFIANTGEEIIATIINGAAATDPIDSITYRRLSPFILNQVTALSYKNDVMVVKVDGVGLNGLKIVSLDGADIKESTVSLNGASQAFLRLAKPKEIVEVILENSSGLKARSVVLRP